MLHALQTPHSTHVNMQSGLSLQDKGPGRKEEEDVLISETTQERDNNTQRDVYLCELLQCVGMSANMAACPGRPVTKR